MPIRGLERFASSFLFWGMTLRLFYIQITGTTRRRCRVYDECYNTHMQCVCTRPNNHEEVGDPSLGQRTNLMLVFRHAPKPMTQDRVPAKHLTIFQAESLSTVSTAAPNASVLRSPKPVEPGPRVGRVNSRLMCVPPGAFEENRTID